MYYDRWSLQLLGAPPWRQASVAYAEIGWHLTGFARAVRDVSLRLAKLLLSGRTDIYVQGFNEAQDAVGSWNERSRQLLSDWCLIHPSELVADCDASYSKYKANITKTLSKQTATEQQVSIRQSSAALPHYLVHVDYPSTLLAQCARVDVDWDTAVGVRGFIRIRANLVDLTHTSIHGGQICIFGDTSCWNPVKHVVSLCRCWSALRHAVEDQLEFSLRSADKMVVAILSATPSHQHFKDAVKLCHEIDVAAAHFWKIKTVLVC